MDAWMMDSLNLDGSLSRAVEWLSQAMTGPVATTIGTLAVAMVGVLLLGGRLPIRRGVLTIVGCFVVFSASAIAASFVAGIGPPAVALPNPLTEVIQPASPSREPKPYDPYAGVGVPSQQEQPIIR